MNFRSKTSPYIRDKDATIFNMMLNVIIALTPVILCALYVYKIEYLLVLLVSLVSVLLPEFVFNKLEKKPNSLNNLTAIITAIIYSLTLPSGIQLWIVLAGGLFASIFAKAIFGGMGNNIFNPAAIGRAFVLISFGGVIAPVELIDATTTATPLSLFATDTDLLNMVNYDLMTSQYSIIDLLIGNSSGAFGETFRLAIILGGVYLLYTKVADYRIMLSTILTFFIMSLLYAFGNDINLNFAIFQVLSGGLLFGAVFMATDPVTGPSTPPSRVMYGILIGGITFIIRMYGAYVEGMIFAILIMNMFAPLLDYSGWVSTKYTKGWLITIGATSLILASLALFVV